MLRCRHRHRFRQVLELLHAAQLFDDLQHFEHMLESAQRLDRVGDLLDLLQRDRAALASTGFQRLPGLLAAAGLAAFFALPPLLSLPLMVATWTA